MRLMPTSANLWVGIGVVLRVRVMLSWRGGEKERKVRVVAPTDFAEMALLDMRLELESGQSLHVYCCRMVG